MEHTAHAKPANDDTNASEQSHDHDMALELTGDDAAVELTPEQAQAVRILTLEAELAALKDQSLRAMAEADNTRKRAQREMEEMSRYAVTGFARELVSVIENLQRAAASIPPEARAGSELLKTMGEGVEMTQQQLLGIFEKHGIRRIDPLGEKFDHNRHQAVVQIETGDAEPGIVVQVMQAGYSIHDRLLQPAMVGVSKAPSGDAK